MMQYWNSDRALSDSCLDFFFSVQAESEIFSADLYLCLTVEYSGELYEKIKFDFVVILISSADQ